MALSLRSPRAGWMFAVAGFVLLAALALVSGLRQPIYNWDLIVYTAIVHGGGEQDACLLHRRTFDEVQRTVPAEAFARLIAADGVSVPDAAYRQAVYQRPEVFAEQLAFYRGRPLFVAMLRGLHRAGLNVVDAAALVSTVSMVLVAACIMVSARVLLPPPMLLVVVMLAIAYGIPSYAGMASPDPLAMAFVAVAMALLAHGRIAGCLSVLLLAMAVRPDLVMLLLVSAAVTALPPDAVGRRRLVAIGFGAAGLVTYAVLDRLSGHPGLGVVMYHTMVERLLLPLSEPRVFGIGEHLAILPARLSSFVQRGSLPLFGLVLGACGLVAVKAWRGGAPRPPLMSVGVSLVAISGLSVLGHFLVYPLGQERFYVMQFIFGSIGAIRVAGDAVACRP